MTRGKFYAGIGSRETPENVLLVMELIAAKMCEKGWILRSGGAPGADTAFENGLQISNNPYQKEIYLPWRGFNGRTDTHKTFYGVCQEALEIAEKFHPNWPACSDAAKKLHARNAYQILGKSLDTPSDLVICWTKDGSGKGGTGQALRMAKHYGIRIHDLGVQAIFEKYKDHLEE